MKYKIVLFLIMLLLLTATRTTTDSWAEGVIQNDTQETILIHHAKFDVTLHFRPGTYITYASMDTDRIYIYTNILYIDRNAIGIEHCLPYWTASSIIGGQHEINATSSNYLMDLFISKLHDDEEPDPFYVCPVN